MRENLEAIGNRTERYLSRAVNKHARPSDLSDDEVDELKSVITKYVLLRLAEAYAEGWQDAVYAASEPISIPTTPKTENSDKDNKDNKNESRHQKSMANCPPIW